MNKNPNPNSNFDIFSKKNVVWPAALLMGTIAVVGARQAVPGGGNDVAPIRPTETQAPMHEAVSSPVVFPTQEAQGIYGQFNPAYEQAGAAMVKEIVDSADVLAKAGVVSVQNQDTIELSNGPTNDHVATQESVMRPVNQVGVSAESTMPAKTGDAIIAGGPTAPAGPEANPGDPYNPNLSNGTQPDATSTEAVLEPNGTMPANESGSSTTDQSNDQPTTVTVYPSN